MIVVDLWEEQDDREILAIHECFVAVPSLINKFKFTPQGALAVGTGKVIRILNDSL